MTETKSENKAVELYEMRNELLNSDYNLKIVTKNLSTLNINLKKTEIVIKEIESLEDTSKLYDRCGRIFVLSTKDQIIEKLTDTKKKMIAEVDSQSEKKKFVEKAVAEQSKLYMEVLKSSGVK